MMRYFVKVKILDKMSITLYNIIRQARSHL